MKKARKNGEKAHKKKEHDWNWYVVKYKVVSLDFSRFRFRVFNCGKLRMACGGVQVQDNR